MYLQLLGVGSISKKRYLSLIEVLLSLALVGFCLATLFYGLQKNLQVTLKNGKDAEKRYTYHFLQKKLGTAFYTLECKKNSFFFTEKGVTAPFQVDFQILVAGHSSAKNILEAKNVKMFCLYVDLQNRLQLLSVIGKKKELETLCEKIESISYSFLDGLALQKDPSSSKFVSHWEKELNRFPQAVQIAIKTKDASFSFFFLINENGVTAEVF